MFNDPIFRNRPTRAEISLDNLENNIRVIRDIVGKTRVMGVVKANAYGHGLIEISKKLESLKLDYIGVAYLEEAVFLRKNGIKIPILVLGAIDSNQIEIFLKNNIDITGSSIERLEQISKVAKKLNSNANVHLKIDTGMARIGVQWDRKEEFLEKAFTLPNLNIVGIFSHFASSSDDKEYTHEQLIRFNTVLSYLKEKYKVPSIVHMANSGAISNSLEDSFFDMVRPGLIMYGYSSNPEIQKLLKPVMSFKTKVSYFKVLNANQSVGYDRTYFTKDITRIVTLPLGYADGYPTSLSNNGYVFIRGNRYPIAGKVCMDQTMVDIGKNGEAYVGDDVELWGENISLLEISKISNRSPWEILTGISERVPRIYKDSL